ncbi:lipopolysaccharide biosynthesis protein [Halorubrum xinjiangense]|uniref:lipopolysaccharide biosynthesis protein n=1 Tax=Halorubrum xinjiangense TaxID=261291 RepID=UPI003C6F0C6C
MKERSDQSFLTLFGRDFGLYTLANALPAILGLIGVMVFSRVFDPAPYGRYSLVLVVVMTVSTGVYSWLEQSVLRFESEDVEILPTVEAILLYLTIFVSVISLLVFTIIEPAIGQYRRYYLVAVVSVVGVGTFDVLRAFFQANLNPRYITYFQGINSLLKLLVGVVISLLVLENIVGWMWGTALGSIFTIGVMLHMLDVELPSLDTEIAKQLFRYGAPMVGWLFGLTLLNFIDRVILEWLSGASAVGIYSSNYSLVHTGLPLVLNPVIQSSHPVIMDRWNGENSEEVSELITKYSRYFLLIGVGATIFTAIISKPLSSVVLGQSFHEGYIIIPIIGLSLFFWNIAMLGHKGLELKSMTEFMTAGILISVILNILLNYLLIPQFGYVGASFATLISSLSYLIFSIGSSKYTVAWRVPNSTIKNILVSGTPAVALGGAVYLIQGSQLLWIVFAGFGACGLYILSLISLREVKIGDIKQLVSRDR